MKRIAVGDIMTRNIVSVKPSKNLQECIKILVKKRINSLPVIENKRLVGILTSRDILWVLTKKAKSDLKKIKAIDIAKRKVAVIKPSADITEAIEKMKAVNFRRLPVLSRGELLGVVTLKDILRIAPELYEHVHELEDIREEGRKMQSLDKEWLQEGFCEGCGSFSDLLKVYDQLLCPDCREELF